jgi:hypothetical protein
MSNLISQSFPSYKSETMSSIEISQLTGKTIGNIHRDIKSQIIEGLYNIDIKADSNLNRIDLKGIFVIHRDNGQIKEIKLDREHTLTLITGYDVKSRHAINKRWIELEHGKQSHVSQEHSTFFELDKQMRFANLVSDSMRLSPESKMLMFSNIAKENGIPTSILPSYVAGEASKSLSELLKDHGSQLSSRGVNPILEALGYIEKQHRKGFDKQEDGKSKQVDKHFWNVTEKGKQYGKNHINPSNPKQTQPHWYIDKFAGLLNEINKYLTIAA